MASLQGNSHQHPFVNHTSPYQSLYEPVMHGLSSLLLLGACAYQTVFGRPEVSQPRHQGELLRRSVDSFISTEKPYAMQQLLCNIGPSGCHSSGVQSGIVIASPDKANPDCKSLCAVAGLKKTRALSPG